MPRDGDFEIDLQQSFPQLAAPPIVEAVLHWTARIERPLDRNELLAELSKRLPDYPILQDHNEVHLEMRLEMSDEGPNPSTQSAGGWYGYRLSRPKSDQVAIFRKDGLIYSRLQPYQGWDSFEGEGRRLWQIFKEIGSPSQLDRIGLRFINRISVPSNRSLSEYLRDPPTRPMSLPLAGFLYQSTFALEREGLAVNVIKTLQPEDEAREAGLILDIDVFTTRATLLDSRKMDEALLKMRWLKNAIFFELLTTGMIEELKEGSGV